ncbi:MAG: Eco57I restriction-modification methylase domain-containing protein [Pyrinomonadaceae bacterium]
MRGQPAELLLSKINSMVFDVSEFDAGGNVPVVEVANRLKQALDVEKVTKKFYNEYQDEHLAFLQLIKGLKDERQRRWYASVLLNRLMFIYFLQRKGFIDNDYDYLQKKLAASRKAGSNRYYSDFLTKLFFVGFAKPDEDAEKKAAKSLLGDVPYLNGGLFLQHKIELENPNIQIPDKAFDNIFKLFSGYSWNLDDTAGGQADEISPHVLGYIFEKYINQKSFGAYYTRPEITQYLCEQTIYKLILDRVNHITAPLKEKPDAAKPAPTEVRRAEPKGAFKERRYDSMPDLLMDLDSWLCRFLLDDVLPQLKLLDPACGSGAFLVAAMKTLINVYSAITGKVEFLGDAGLKAMLAKMRREHHGSVDYLIKKRIITDNLFGVDIMEEATDIAKLRLFLALVASAKTRDQLEPLPNIDFNILTGNSLIGLMHVDDKEFDKRNAQGNLFLKSYRDLVRETANDIRVYRDAATYNKDLRQLRDSIETKKREVAATLNEILLNQFTQLGIKFEQATWDEKKNKEGKPQKRAVRLSDIEALHPFHWGFEFDEVINKNGGFDAIIANPPWEVFQTDEKEFFREFVPTIQKKKLRIEDWQKQQSKLMKDPSLRDAWLTYASRFPHLAKYFKNTSQYKNQSSIVNGKNVGSKINLYSYFVEQCFNLLRTGGECGIVVPSGVYTDLGNKQLREMLFGKTKITGLFGFENRKEIFEGVHRSYKFVVLTFTKGGATERFPAVFMRLDVEELEGFPETGGFNLSVQLIRQLSPDSLSVMEFKSDVEVRIAEKMSRFPVLHEKLADSWNVTLCSEFNMTTDSFLFKNAQKAGLLPLYEGKMIHQFDPDFSKPRYWVHEKDARKVLLGRGQKDKGQHLEYQDSRLAFRDIARNTDVRTMIATAIPPNTFAGNTLVLSKPFSKQGELLLLVAVLNSFALDFIVRRKVTAHCNIFYIYQLPVPRIPEEDSVFPGVVQRAAKLIYTTPEFDDLAREVGLGDHRDAVTDPVERDRLRAELDGMIAHLYGLTEKEFAYILTTFPIVEQSVKDAALEAYRQFAPKPGDQEIAALITKGESATLEFNPSARWDLKQNVANKEMENVIVKTVAALLNTEGGALLIGVADEGTILGLEKDYKMFGKKNSRDAFENFLTTLLLNNLGKDSSALFSNSFHELEAKDVVKVAVKPSPKPVFVKDDKGEHLYIRAGNSTRLLTTKEALDYCKIRWPG